jgi:hypothetical protein
MIARYNQLALAGLRHRAKRLGLPFDLTMDDVLNAPTVCPCCGISMERGGDRRTSPSADRLVPSLGYTKRNVVWVCLRCNQIKNDATLAEIYRVADFYYEEYRARGMPCPTRLRPLPCESEAATSTSRDRIDGEDGGGGLSQPDNPNQKEGEQ